MNVEGRIVNPHQLQLSMLMQDLHELRRERTKLQARMKNVTTAAEEGDKDELIAEILRESSENNSAGSYVATHDQYVELKVQEQELLNQFGSDHPELKSLRRKIDVVDRMRMEELSMLRAGGLAAGEERNIIEDYLSQVRRKIDTLTTEEEKLSVSVVEEQKKSTSVAALVENLNTLQRERERLEKGYYTIVEQLSQINALKEHLWRNLSVLTRPHSESRLHQACPSVEPQVCFWEASLACYSLASKTWLRKHSAHQKMLPLC